jgi:hypothetical protein
VVNARSIAGYQPSECHPHSLAAILEQSHGRQRSSSTEVIEIPDAALGARPDAPTLEGPVTVKIAAGTQSGAAIIQAHGDDVNLQAANIVHLLLGAAFLIFGWLGAPQPSAPTESRA